MGRGSGVNFCQNQNFLPPTKFNQIYFLEISLYNLQGSFFQCRRTTFLTGKQSFNFHEANILETAVFCFSSHKAKVVILHSLQCSLTNPTWVDKAQSIQITGDKMSYDIKPVCQMGLCLSAPVLFTLDTGALSTWE